MLRSKTVLCAGLLLLAIPAHAGVAAITGSPSPVVFMENGDVLRYGSGRWTQVQNIFTYARANHCPSAGGTIVGAAVTYSDRALYVMTDRGGVLRGSQDGWAWSCEFEGRTIFDEMGLEPGTIATFGPGQESVGELLALTTAGDVFRAIMPTRFEHLGNIYGEPTPTLIRTLGTLKAQYR